MREVLMEWCNDHYKHFGFYPAEFEYGEKVYKIVLPNFKLEEIK